MVSRSRWNCNVRSTTTHHPLETVCWRARTNRTTTRGHSLAAELKRQLLPLLSTRFEDSFLFLSTRKIDSLVVRVARRYPIIDRHYSSKPVMKDSSNPTAGERANPNWTLCRPETAISPDDELMTNGSSWKGESIDQSNASSELLSLVRKSRTVPRHLILIVPVSVPQKKNQVALLSRLVLTYRRSVDFHSRDSPVHFSSDSFRTVALLHDGDVSLLVASWTSSRDCDDAAIATWSAKVTSVNCFRKIVHSKQRSTSRVEHMVTKAWTESLDRSSSTANPTSNETYRQTIQNRMSVVMGMFAAVVVDLRRVTIRQSNVDLASCSRAEQEEHVLLRESFER